MSSTSDTSTANQELDLPVQDKRTYHAFTLPKNGLRCLVIHDPVDETKNDGEEDEDMEEEDEEMEEDGEEGGENSKNGSGKGSGGGHKAAVSTTVAVGQLHDGANWPGRAHLTEHLLFLGSQKYPTENELDAYLNKHGGHSNAYTDLDHTCYFMDCSSNALQGALDRWAASMTAPLLQVGSVEREIQAIESEHQKNVLSDYWRFFQLSKRLMLTSKPKPNATSNSSVEASKHPYASFGNGCFDSLVPQSASSATATPAATTTTTTDSTDNDAKEGSEDNANDNDDNKQARITALRDAVAEFVQIYYKAELMTLTVSSSHSIDDMVKWVTMYFSDVPSGGGGGGGDANRPLSHDPPPVLPNLTLDHWTLPVSVHVVPTREGRTLELQWPLPREMQSLYETKPTRILSHLLGHEGPGSLVALLRQQQWAQDLCADDVSRSNRHFCIFQVQIELTTTGWQHHVSDIVRLVFAYLQLLREGSGIPSWVYEELKVTADMQFRFLSQQGAMDTVSSLSVNLLQYPPKRYISGPFQFFADEVPMDIVQECLQTALVPENMLQVVGAPEYHQEDDTEMQGDEAKNQKDAWYGTEYRVVDFDKDMFECWKNPKARRSSPNKNDEEFDKHEDLMQELIGALHLPEPNDMLPTDFDLKIADKKYFALKESTPRCLMDNGETMRLWYKPDTAFGMPKVNILILLRSSLAYSASPMHAVLANMWSEVIHEICNEEFTYQASMAGLHCEFSNSRKGLQINVSGYNHKAAILLKRVVHAANEICTADTSDKTELTPELFERIQEKLEKQWMAFLVAQPYQHAIYAADLCMEQPKWHFKSQMECIKELDRGDLIRFSKQMFSRMHLEVLVHGNVTAQEAQDMAQILLDGWKPSRPLTLPEMRVVQLPQQKQYSETIYRMLGWNEPDSNSVVANIYQIGEMEAKENATLSVLGQLIREPAFNQLRTEEQMGYIVFSQVKTIGDNIKGLMVLVQGDTYDPLHMDERIEIFLDSFRTKLVELSDEDFTHNIAAVCQTLLEKKKNLIEESSGYWNVISNQTYRFRRLQEIAAHALTVTKTDVLCMFDRYVLRTSPHRRRLSVQVFGSNHRDRINVDKNTDDQDGKKILWIEDPVEFARGQSLFPVQATAPLNEDLRMDI